MSTITSILSSDLISNSRAVINTNFTNLNADKVESSVLSGSYSTSSVISATYATKTNALTVVPLPPSIAVGADYPNNTNTVLAVGQVIIPTSITVNKVSLRVEAVTTPGTMKLALYSEDGQTQIFTHTTTSISATGVNTFTLSSAVVVAPGVYYFATLPVGTAQVTLRCYNIFDSTDSFNSVSSEPVLSGTITVTASTLPATITPATITASTARLSMLRLDN